MRNPYSFGCLRLDSSGSAVPKFKILNCFGLSDLARQMLKYDHRRSAASWHFARSPGEGRGSTHSAAGTETCGRKPMEGVQFPPIDGPNNDNLKQACAECGIIFEMRTKNGSVEMICDACYSGQFEPVRIHHWQRIPSRLRRAR